MTLRKPLRSALLTLVAAASMAGGALASAHAPAPNAADVNGFGSTVPSSALAGFVAKPLYREGPSTGGSLVQVPCASAATGDTSVCYSAR